MRLPTKIQINAEPKYYVNRMDVDSLMYICAKLNFEG